MTGLTARIASDDVIERAYAWVCARRAWLPAGDDVWGLRFAWEAVRPRLQDELLAGRFAFEPVRRLDAGGRAVSRWTARDALVLKAVTLVLTEALGGTVDGHCYHVCGHGGLKGAVRAVQAAVGEARFVARSDVASYYDSIDHGLLLARLRGLVGDWAVLMLIERYLEHLVDVDGMLRLRKRGISAGCPLSPLLGAVYLHELDAAMGRLRRRDGIFYARYMDDWVVLAPTRWKLRRAVAAMNAVLARLRLRKHPDKTFIGRVSRGFDFLGYRFGDVQGGLGVAEQTMARFAERVARLYEQGASDERIGLYVRRWWRWVTGGGLTVQLDAPGGVDGLDA